MDRLAHPWLVTPCRWAIGIVFIAAGLAKIGDVPGFAQQIHNFRMVPIAAENVVALTLPWIEVVAGVALLIGLRARAAAFLGTLLLVVFTVAIGIAVARGLSIECGCFGKASAATTGWKKIFQNVGLIAVGYVASLRSRIS